MKSFFEKNFINFGVAAVTLLIFVSAFLNIYNKSIMTNAMESISRTEMVRKQSHLASDFMRKIDVSLQAYALIREERFLNYKLEDARKDNISQFKMIDSLLAAEGYTSANYEGAKAAIGNYVDYYKMMINHLREDNMEAFLAEMRKEHGAVVSKAYIAYADELKIHQDRVMQEAYESFEAASFRSSLVLFLLVIVGSATLFLIVVKIRKQETERKKLLQDVENNNRKFLFNPGTPQEENGNIILEKSIYNLEKASEFVTKLTQGNYDVNWEELDSKNKELNKENLVGKLILMQEQMKKVKAEDNKRLWVTEGLAQLSDIIRNHQNSLDELAEKCMLFLVKYLKAQQGGLFILQEEEHNEPYLKLAACYAFERKKFIQKEIALGEGLVGQVFLEAQSVTLTEIPDGYVSIRSGLGDAAPGALLVVPMKYNESVKAVAEFASFRKFQEDETLFIEKAGEFIASAIATAYNNDKTQKLLEELKEQTENMRAQEEELRQNMEELQATQEQMRRKQLEREQSFSEEDSQI